MFLLKCFVIICSIFAFGNCILIDDQDENVTTVRIQINHDSQTTIEFKFEKKELNPNALIIVDTYDLDGKNVINFKSLEDQFSKKFQNKEPLQKKADDVLLICVEYDDKNNKKKIKPIKYILRDYPEIIEMQLQPNSLKRESEIELDVRSSMLTFKDEYNMDEDEYKFCEKYFKNSDPALPELFSYEEENACKIEQENLLNTALKYSNFGTHLLLKGLKNNDKNPVDVIRDIIGSEMELYHLEYEILQAKYIADGLLFEMKSQKDVVEILSKVDLMKSRNLIFELTDRTIFELKKLRN